MLSRTSSSSVKVWYRSTILPFNPVWSGLPRIMPDYPGLPQITWIPPKGINRTQVSPFQFCRFWSEDHTSQECSGVLMFWKIKCWARHWLLLVHEDLNWGSSVFGVLLTRLEYRNAVARQPIIVSLRDTIAVGSVDRWFMNSYWEALLLLIWLLNIVDCWRCVLLLEYREAVAKVITWWGSDCNHW